MFWTKWVITFCKIIICVLVIGFIIVSGTIMDEEPLLGFVALIGGILFSISSVAIIMMMTEISKSNYETSVLLDKLVNGDNGSNKANEKTKDWFCTACETKNKEDYTHCFYCGLKKSEKVEKSECKTDWTCLTCGKKNKASDGFCKSCGVSKELNNNGCII